MLNPFMFKIAFYGAMLLFICSGLYVFYDIHIKKPKETIIILRKELSDTKIKLESCEVGAKIDIDSALNEQSFNEANQIIKELEDEDKKISDDNLSIIDDKLNWVF